MEEYRKSVRIKERWCFRPQITMKLHTSLALLPLV
jgi:hypothetical protein